MSPSRLIRLTRRVAFTAAGVVGGTSAFAASTTLSGSIFTSTPGTLVQQSFFDVRSATLTGLSTGDAVGNACSADGQLLAPTGLFILTAGARSGGGPGTGGQSNAQAHCDTAQTYLITSATLPPGTLVPVTIAWALDGHAYAAGNLTYYTSGAMGQLDGRVVVLVNGVSVMNKSGIYRRGFDIDSGGHIRGYDFVSGTLNIRSDFAVISTSVPVGQTVQVAMDMTTSGVTTAVAASTTGGDAEIAMLWGVSVTGANAVAVLQSNPSEAAPSAANATPANAAAASPPRPAGSLNCLTFSTQPAPLIRCTSELASFSVVATTGGPFTYQWRRNSVAINPALNPSATTPTLSFNNVSGADSGTYDCVVTNSCGSVASNPATLTVLDPSDPACAGPCPCPADFDASGGTPDASDIDAFFTAWLTGDATADADCSGGTPDASDIDAFFVAWLNGGC